MSGKYCKFFNNGVTFHYKGITFCNKLNDDFSFYKYEEDFLNKFLAEREKLIEDMKQSKPQDFCQNCMYLSDVEDYSQISEKFKLIEIYHWTQCNCACFYCSNRGTTHLAITEKKNMKGTIDILPILKELKKRDLIDSNTEISFVGGEPTILKEFVDLLKFFIKTKCKVNILTNGILYEKYIPKALKINNSYLTISLDCGTQETFKRIKGVDKFNDVVKNIKRYIKESKKVNSEIMIKYMILEGVNDTKEEIDKFIDICAEIGVTNYFPSIEFCHAFADRRDDKISDNICMLYNYMKQRIKEKNEKFIVSTYDFVDKMIETKTYKIR